MASKKRRKSAAAPNPAWTFSPFTLAAILAAVLFLLYAPSLSSDFVYDAQAQIKFDPYLHEHSHLADILTLRVLNQDIIDGNRPVHLFVLMLDSILWGKNPFGYHLTSLLLHCANAAVLFLLLLNLLPAPSIEKNDGTKRFSFSGALPALLGTLLFAVHPLQVETVAEVSYREDLLATFFLLTALYASCFFPGSSRRQAWGFGGICVAALLLAAGSKETGYAGSLLLFIYWGLFRRSGAKRPWAGLAAATVLLVGAFIAALFLLHPKQSQFIEHTPGYLGGSLSSVFVLQPRIWAFQIGKLFWPENLSADYIPQNIAAFIPVSFASYQEILSILVVLVFVSAQITLSWKNRTAALGSLIFWIGLAPVCNLIPLFRPVADRFLYLPMAGAALLLASVVERVRRYPAAYWPLCGTLMLACLVFIPFNLEHQEIFSNSLALWQDTCNKSPGSFTAFNNLGYAYITNGNPDSAFPAFQRAIQLSDAKNEDALSGMAITFEMKNLTSDAEEMMQKAIALNPKYLSPLTDPMQRFENPRFVNLKEQIAQRIRARQKKS
jgi:protein O-mannosyl-transferase